MALCIYKKMLKGGMKNSLRVFAHRFKTSLALVYPELVTRSCH